MENDCGMEDEDFPYIDSTIKDTRGLIHVYVAAVNKTSEVHIPNVQFPLLQDLDNDMGHRWRIFAANYSFQELGLGVPGQENIRKYFKTPIDKTNHLYFLQCGS